MWMVKNRVSDDRSKLRYPSDLTDDECALVVPLISTCQARRQQAPRRCARSNERDHVCFEHRMPVAGDPRRLVASDSML